MTVSAATGQGRITVFSMFGPAFAYVTRLVGGQQIAYVGPVTPGVHWRKVRQMAARCSRATADDQEKARWIITQANRALICGSDVIVKLSDEKWEMGDVGWRVDVGSWCNQNVLVVGDMNVPSLTADQVASQPTLWPHYAA
jgi:hypothetical protein